MRGRDKAVQGYVEYGTCLRCEMLCSTVHSGTVQCSTVRCSAADYSTVQYSTVQHGTVYRSTAVDTVGWAAPHHPSPSPLPYWEGNTTWHSTALHYAIPHPSPDWTGLELRIACGLLSIVTPAGCTVLWCTCTVLVLWYTALHYWPVSLSVHLSVCSHSSLCIHPMWPVDPAYSVRIRGPSTLDPGPWTLIPEDVPWSYGSDGVAGMVLPRKRFNRLL